MLLVSVSRRGKTPYLVLSNNGVFIHPDSFETCIKEHYQRYLAVSWGEYCGNNLKFLILPANCENKQLIDNCMWVEWRFHIREMESECYYALSRFGSLFDFVKNNRYCTTCGGKCKIDFFHEVNQNDGDTIENCDYEFHVNMSSNKSFDQIKADCTDCGKFIYPRTNPCVIVGIHTQDKILLVRKEKSSCWSNVAGFVEAGEDPEACVYREIWEEAGLEKECVKSVQFFGTQPWSFPNNLMIGYILEITNPTGELFTNDKDEIAELKLWDPKKDMPPYSGTGSIGHSIITEVLKRIEERNKLKDQDCTDVPI